MGYFDLIFELRKYVKNNVIFLCLTKIIINTFGMQGNRKMKYT